MERDGETPESPETPEMIGPDARRSLDPCIAPFEDAPAAVATGWGADRALSRRLGSFGALESGDGVGLPRAAVHEWFHATSPRSGARGGNWTAPLAVLTHVAARALDVEAGRTSVLWIGRAVWPYPRALVRDHEVRPVSVPPAATGGLASDGLLHAEELELVVRRGARDARALLDASIFVDVSGFEGPARRLWAIDLALRCPSVAAVVADASGLDMAATRRLQLAAEAGEGLGLFARPAWEERALSAAATRWRVRPCVTRATDDPHGLPRWTLELLRCKSVLGYGATGLGGARDSDGADGAACAGF